MKPEAPGREERGDLVTVAAIAPGMILRIGVNLLRAKRRAKRTGRVFERELLRNGVPAQQAKMLVEEYLSVVKFSFWTRNLAGLGVPFMRNRF